MLVSYLAALVFCAAQDDPLSVPAGTVRAQEPSALPITDLSERLIRSVADRDPASRTLWLEVSQKVPAHPSLAATLPELPQIPFCSGTVIPTDATEVERLPADPKTPFPSGTLISTDLLFEEGLPGHLCLPAAAGIRVLMENEAEILISLDPSGVAASTKSKLGKEIMTWSDDVLGIKWSATNPELLKLSYIRKALSVNGPTMDRYHDAVYWLPDDHVSFAGEVWSYTAKVKRADYKHGDSDWGDAFFRGQPSPRCRNNLRTRMTPGGGLYYAVCFCPRDASPQVALIWMRKSNLKGRYLAPLDILAQESVTIPFDFVPWGKERQPTLLVISRNRIPVLMRLSADGAEQLAQGVPVPKELVIGAPTWCDINKDGLLEIVAPVTDEEGTLSIIVLLAEEKAPSGK